jgi:ankyrin repeat protein
MTDSIDLKKIIAENTPEQLTQLITGQPSLLTHIEDNRQPENLLSLAVSRNNYEQVKTLIDLGAKPIESNDTRCNLLLKFINSSSHKNKPDIEMLELLLKAGIEYPLENKEDAQSFLKYTFANDFAYGNFHLLPQMAEFGFSPIELERKAEKSLISVLIKRSCDVAIIQFLLELGCSIEALKDEYNSPLYHAIKEENYEVASLLLDKGAISSEIPSILNIIATSYNMPKHIIDILAEGQNLNQHLPIHTAIDYNNADFLRYLVEHGADINRSTRSSPILIYAIEIKNKKIFSLLIQLGADINQKNEDGNTALDIAMTKPGYKQICSLLIKSGAKTNVELSNNTDNADILFANIEKSIDTGESWSNLALNWLKSLDQDQANTWYKLLRHCRDNQSAKPSKKWLSEALDLTQATDSSLFRVKLLEWLPLIKNDRVTPLYEDEAEDEDEEGTEEYEYWEESDKHIISEGNTLVLKGFIWLASQFADNEISACLRDVATQMYKKVYGIGMRNAKLANAAIISLSVMPNDFGLKEIILLRAATKYNPALTNINRVFNQLAKDRNQTPDELAELSIPDYGLTSIGAFNQHLGEFEAQVKLISVGKCELIWQGTKDYSRSHTNCVCQ